MSKLKASTRDKLKASDFALPGERKYPLENRDHARMALAMVAKYGSPEEIKKVREAVKRKYPDIDASGAS